MDTNFAAINVVASDLARSIAFYRLLGLDFVIDADHPTHASAELPNGVHVMLDAQEAVMQFAPTWSPPTGSSRVAFAFDAPSAEAVDALHAALVNAGYESMRKPWSAEWGIRYATILDPDGVPADIQASL